MQANNEGNTQIIIHEGGQANKTRVKLMRVISNGRKSTLHPEPPGLAKIARSHSRGVLHPDKDGVTNWDVFELTFALSCSVWRGCMTACS